MTSSYAHVMDRRAVAVPSRLESPITANVDNLQAKKNFSVSHLLDLEEAGEMVGAQADESVAETGRTMLESPGLTSGSDTAQPESKCSLERTLNKPGRLQCPGIFQLHSNFNNSHDYKAALHRCTL